MENLLHNKMVLWGGAAVLAVIAGVWVYSSVGSSTSAAAPAAAALDTGAPVLYSSGTGTTPIDSSGVSTGGQSSLDTLASLLTAQQGNTQAQQDYQNASLTASYNLGMANINANQNMNNANTSAALTSSLATVAAALTQSVVSAKATSAVTGQINGGGQNFNYTVEQITGKSGWNTVLQNQQGGGITLANGQVIKG